MRRSTVIVLITLALISPAAATDILPIGLTFEAGVARSGGGLSDTTPIYAGVFDYRLSEHFGWRLRGGLLKFEEPAAQVQERFLQLNVTYFPRNFSEHAGQPQFYLTGGLGLHDTQSRGLGQENRDKPKGGANAGMGFQVALSKQGIWGIRLEALYTSVKQVNPANFVSATVGLKFGL